MIRRFQYEVCVFFLFMFCVVENNFSFFFYEFIVFNCQLVSNFPFATYRIIIVIKLAWFLVIVRWISLKFLFFIYIYILVLFSLYIYFCVEYTIKKCDVSRGSHNDFILSHFFKSKIRRTCLCQFHLMESLKY